MGEIFAGRYELVDPVGRGGVGTVWRAWDHRRRRYVAAKVLQQSDAYTLLRFVREQALRIDHPHVLAPHSWAADDEKVLFTMDLVAGGSLAHLVGDYGPLPPTFVCTLLDQLLSGLAAVHAEDVVHRDIKPANILLEPTGTGRPHLRLSDFGIAMRKGEPRLTETNYVVGTPGYFAPEQMLEAEADFPSDLYAVGLVGLFLLTGRKPDSQALFESYENGTPPPPGGVPEPLWQVLGQLLQPDPAARFRTATGARKALASAAELLDGDATVERETVEVFDHLGPLPEGFGPDGPVRAATPHPAGPHTPATGSAPHASAAAPPTAAPSARGAAPHAAPAPLTTPTVPRPSDTGSFVLQPPAPHASTAVAPAVPHPAQGPYSGAVPQGPGAHPYAAARTAVPPLTAPPAPPRRPGPPAKVAVPMLVVAVVCLITGFWALAAAG
ncbi:protein kinase domain-containing protein [Streptomyces albus]|uniref:serine/threonine-protein kinase n=1 Tax=Streptomyces albus TaxID=1888 RepID=UPI003F1B2F59